MSKRPSRGVSSGVGFPTRMTGRDGDLTIRKTKEGKILYVKEHGKWHPINTGVDVAQMKKDVDRLIRSVNTLRNDNNPYPTINALNIRKNVATATVDPKITFTVAGTDIFTMGVDTNDSDSFVIAQSSALGTTNKLTMTTAGAVTLASALGVASGGTALSTYSGAGRILQSTGADVLVATQTLHDDIQGNITKLGAITEGSWGGTYETVLPTSKGGVSVTGTDENAVLTLGASSNNFIAEGGMKFFDSGGYNHLEFTSSSTDDAVIITSADTAHNVAGDDVTLRAGNTTPGDTDNIAGGHLYLQGGKGKGTGVGGSIHLTVYPAGSTGDTLNTPVTPLIINGSQGTISLSKAVGFGITTVTQGSIVGDASPATGNNTDVDFRLGNKAKLTLTGGATVGILGFVFPAVSGNFSLILTQDGTGTGVVTNYNAYESDTSDASGSATLLWAGGANPTLTTTANKSDIISIYWDQGAQKAYATITQNF